MQLLAAQRFHSGFFFYFASAAPAAVAFDSAASANGTKKKDWREFFDLANLCFETPFKRFAHYALLLLVATMASAKLLANQVLVNMKGSRFAIFVTYKDQSNIEDGFAMFPAWHIRIFWVFGRNQRSELMGPRLGIRAASLVLSLSVLTAEVHSAHAGSVDNVDSQEPSQDEILVLAKLDIASIKFTARRGRLSCRIVKKTGDREIDKLACEAVRNCYSRLRTIDQATLDCIPPERLRLVREYVAARRK